MKDINKVKYNKYKFREKINKAKEEKVQITEAEYKKINNSYELFFEENYENNTYDHHIWIEVPKGPSWWNSTMGTHPQVYQGGSTKFLRLKAIKKDDEYVTAGIKTPIAYGDGKFECEARFNGGAGSWPAIWMTHPNGAQNNYASYYEVDISEYYETRDTTDTTYHCPQSMRGGEKYVEPVHTSIIKIEWNKFEWSWDEDSITICINGVQIMNIANDGNPDHYPINAEDRTFIIILSMQYASNPYLSDPDDSDLPLYMDIRNVKYYKKI